MYLYIITIEWNKELLPEQALLENTLSSNFKYKKLSDTTYLILSSNSAVEIRNYLTSSINSLYRIFIGELSSTAAWRNLMSESDEIKEMFNHE